MKKSSEKTSFQGRYLHLKSCPSTQDVIKNCSVDWFLVQADRQEAGRGQQGREWASPPGGLYYSLRFPAAEGSTGDPLYLLGAANVWLAVLSDRLSEVSDGFGLKWPNDLLHENRKVGGFIGEKANGSIFLGIGINVNNNFDGRDQDGFRLPPISLRNLTGNRLPRQELLFEWYDAFRKSVTGEGSAKHFDLEVIESRMRTIGSTVEYEGNRGRAVGLADNGGLRIRLDDQETVAHRSEDLRVKAS